MASCGLRLEPLKRIFRFTASYEHRLEPLKPIFRFTASCRHRLVLRKADFPLYIELRAPARGL
jgi:hypothetical protein